MIRDLIKGEDYYENAIMETEDNIERYESLLKKVVSERGDTDEGAINGYLILITEYTRYVNLLYSSGCDISKMVQPTIRLIDCYGKTWERNFGYFELIRAVSLAYLTGIKAEDISTLEQRLIKDGFDDVLINYLMSNMDINWPFSSKEFQIPGLYDDLLAIIDKKTENTALKLDNYLNEKWYSIHKDTAWYDTHKEKSNTYYGYWSFETAAIVSLMGIDDSILMQNKYYPYDLAHYKEAHS